MVKAGRSLPRPHHVAWQSPYSNFSSVLPNPTLLGVPAYLNSSTCNFPTVGTLPRLAAPAIPSLKSELTNEAKGFLHYPSVETGFKETHTVGAFQNVNPTSLQQKLLIFDHSGNKTRMFYGPVLPPVQSPIVTATKFAQSRNVNGERQASNMGQKYVAGYSLPEESVKDHIVIEESEYHEDTEEINALLYSDDDFDGDDDDEVTSTDRSPLATKRTYVMQEQYGDAKDKVASSESSDCPNKRLKLIDDGYNGSSALVDNASLVRLNETSECVSDAESKNSSGWGHSVEKTKVDSSMVDGIKSKKLKIRESLRALENLIPGEKGKEPLSVIDGAIEYLKFLMSQTSSNLGVKYD
ncbi:transcription factor bHLH143-like [Lotus japonicus]|uniref:transcription factor bHLH143-like n=1 Tax=Lotus japonicus TaxID=34305 RepID=UPI00258E38C7|nr:transcription factor bHLH143-like [Lotus japonicus]XP_057422438.1 transcription factor bHLH143-like [Lotus japonicus]